MYNFISMFLVVVLILNTSIQSSDIEHEYFPEMTEFAAEDHQDYQLHIREVAVEATVYLQLHQFFTHDGLLYNEIEYSEFAKNYSQIANKYIDKAVRKSRLNEFEKGDTSSYIRVGEQDINFLESLYDCQKARTILINLVHAYIDENYDLVRSVCLGDPLKESRSKVVWAPGCCDIQLHKDCFKQCRQSNIHKCLNSLCQNSDWDTAFYASVFKRPQSKRKFVFLSAIREADCPLCMEPLHKKHTKKEIDTEERKFIIDGNGETAGGKKTRFL